MTHVDVREITRTVLDNGLRVVIAPDRDLAAVGVSVQYDVGYRSEPATRSGFAHLFEHMMFQGSRGVPKLGHARAVQGSGGAFNATTHRDHTVYHQSAPVEALDRLLFLEADRMAGLEVTPENLANQVAVVKEEIRGSVLNRPYGGLPWIDLPPVLFDTFANAHNGYGAFDDLDRATVEDCAAFYDSHYAPGNAVLTVCGDVAVQPTLDAVQRWFGPVPARATATRVAIDEPPLPGDRLLTRVDPQAPLPAVAVGRRMVDPVDDLETYLATVVAAGVLGDGDTSRLTRALVRELGLATRAGATAGLTGGPFQARRPDAFVVTAFHLPTVPTSSVLRAASRELERLAEVPVSAEELARTLARQRVLAHQALAAPGARANRIGGMELLYDRAQLAFELGPRLADVAAADVQRAAARLVDAASATLVLVPAGGPQ